MRRLPLLVTLLLAPFAAALAPHECLLLVNAENPASREVANWFVHLRGVPELNVVEVTPGEEGRRLNIDTNAFRTLVLGPGIEAMKARKLDRHIAAWVYSGGFPAGVRTDPKMSLTGLTFLAGQVPPKAVLDAGAFKSPYFAGPSEPPPVAPAAEGEAPKQPQPIPAGPTAGFISRQRALATGPLLIPAMVLGSTHHRGSTPEEIIAQLRLARQSDHTRPKAPVQFLFQDDIRWACREWQVLPAIQELKSLGVDAALVNLTRPKGPALLGLWTGAKTLDESWLPKFVPGALAEHLTSHAATYDDPVQMKVDEWFRRGVAASAGTVTEPFAIWTKFVHARVYAHYVRGCTAMESLYQAVASPLQTLVAGDPLARPFGPDLAVAARAEVKGGEVALDGEVAGPPGPYEFEWYLNGVVSGRKSGVALRMLDAKEFALGHNWLRLCARMDDPVGVSAWREIGVEISAPGVSLAIDGPVERPASGKTSIAGTAAGLAGEVLLMKGARILDRKPAGAAFALSASEEALGRGPSRLHVEGRTADGRITRSAPVLLWMGTSPGK